MIEFSPEFLEWLTRVAAESRGPEVIWVRCDGRRSAFLESCLAHRSHRIEAGAVFVVHRSADRFRSANAFESDLVSLIEDERIPVEAQLREVPSPRAVIVISRDRLNLSVMSSPVRFPDWFGDLGGRELAVLVRDSETSFSVSIGLDRVESLSRSLHSLDSVLLNRVISWGDNKDFDVCRNGLLQLARDAGKSRGNDDKAFGFFEAEWTRHLSGGRDPSQYRIERRGGVPSILSAVVEVFQQTAPDSLGKVARRWNKVFPVSRDTEVDIGLAYLQRRVPHTGNREDSAIVFWLDLLTAVSCASNLVIAAHHAGDFGEHFPALELDAVTVSLGQSISRGSELLRS